MRLYPRSVRALVVDLAAPTLRAVRRAVEVGIYPPRHRAGRPWEWVSREVPRCSARYRRCGDPTCAEAHP